MKTGFKFKTTIFRPTAAELDDSHEEYINLGIFARELADFLQGGLDSRGYKVNYRCSEDWGYWLNIQHSRNYTLAVGCANIGEFKEGAVEHQIFVEPHTPTIRPLRNWLRKIEVQSDVEALVEVIGGLLRADSRISDVVVENS